MYVYIDSRTYHTRQSTMNDTLLTYFREINREENLYLTCTHTHVHTCIPVNGSTLVCVSMHFSLLDFLHWAHWELNCTAILIDSCRSSSRFSTSRVTLRRKTAKKQQNTIVYNHTNWIAKNRAPQCQSRELNGYSRPAPGAGHSQLSCPKTAVASCSFKAGYDMLGVCRDKFWWKQTCRWCHLNPQPRGSWVDVWPLYGCTGTLSTVGTLKH